MVLKIILFDTVFTLDTALKRGVVCAAGGKKWSEVELSEQLGDRG